MSQVNMTVDWVAAHSLQISLELQGDAHLIVMYVAWFGSVIIS